MNTEIITKKKRIIYSSVKERFTAKVDRTGPPGPLGLCWLWTAGKDPDGYGRFSFNGKKEAAHRVSFQLYKGPVPDGLELHHLCDRPPCVNPKHLKAITHKENVQLGNAGKFQAAKTHCPRGHSYSGKNLYTRPDGKRDCRACRNWSSKKYRKKQRMDRIIKLWFRRPGPGRHLGFI